MRLPPELLRATWPASLDMRFDLSPVQAGLLGSAFHVAVASMLLVRVALDRGTVARVLTEWCTPELMERSGTALEVEVRHLGLHRQHVRFVQGLARRWWASGWTDLRELSGVGRYVAAAVELFCFGCADDAGCDWALDLHASRRTGPRMGETTDGRWYCDGDTYPDALSAYAALRDRRAVGADTGGVP